MKRSVFDTYHPAINFIFFCIVIISSIFTMNPVLLGISFISAGTYAYMLNGKRTVRFILFFILPLILFAAVINAIVNPRGETVIFYTEYSRITMEAALYGICTGIMISSMLLWFSCFTKIMTGDKFTYMFGKIMPSISLIITMVMRFVPDFKGKIQCTERHRLRCHRRKSGRKSQTWHKDNIDNVFLVSGKFRRYGRFHEGERIRSEKTFKFCNI